MVFSAKAFLRSLRSRCAFQLYFIDSHFLLSRSFSECCRLDLGALWVVAHRLSKGNISRQLHYQAFSSSCHYFSSFRHISYFSTPLRSVNICHLLHLFMLQRWHGLSSRSLGSTFLAIICILLDFIILLDCRLSFRRFRWQIFKLRFELSRCSIRSFLRQHAWGSISLFLCRKPPHEPAYTPSRRKLPHFSPLLSIALGQELWYFRHFPFADFTYFRFASERAFRFCIRWRIHYCQISLHDIFHRRNTAWVLRNF